MKKILEQRAEIVRAIRRFFDGRDFVEVETAVRIAAPAPEPHIDCPAAPADDGESPMFLRASPELQMKKLLAIGMDRIYEIGPCFREGEQGSRHNPEFTMIEWYRRGETYLAIKEDLERLLKTLPGGPQSDCQALSVRAAYREYAGWDPWTDWNQDRFDFDMATKIEPALKAMGCVFLMDYPEPAASLALVGESALEPGCRAAQRWEFYWDGLELANCFTELCDADEQRRRFAAAAAERRRLGEADYPLDGEFLNLLPLIGSAAGVALGLDRLVMKLLGIEQIAAVRAPV